MSFSTGEEIIASLNKNLAHGSCHAVVIRQDLDRLQIALKGRGLVLKHGSLLHVYAASNPTLSAWGCVHRCSLAGDVKLAELSSLRMEANASHRAVRFPVQVCLAASFPGEKSCKIFGQTVDLSVSGLRARFDNDVPFGGEIHVVIRVDDSRTVEAVARLVRKLQITPGQGCEVGLEFQRFIKGYEFLVELLPVVQRAA